MAWRQDRIFHGVENRQYFTDNFYFGEPFLPSVPASELPGSLPPSLPERSDRPDDIDVSHGNFTWLSQHVLLLEQRTDAADAAATKCTALQELPSEALPITNNWVISRKIGWICRSKDGLK